ncbi:hypothetical protein B488_12870 [Liberibacter crescens BT-1]|uniref:Uncharacterized protein n=1 Tax=Liberibacter crescens (strain BT-1) TaxID=1215343 RepID=L0EUQ0_LIBCB|nr:hypothetical protein B488_12870 [Liberibacter crescens BT-1]
MYLKELSNYLELIINSIAILYIMQYMQYMKLILNLYKF